MKNEITQEFLEDRFDYQDGHLYNRRNFASSAKKGERAGSLYSNGYVYISIDYKVYLEHRLIWVYFKGVEAKRLDHINRNPSDNRIENLREATQAQNIANSKLTKDAICRSKGVGLRNDGRTKKWTAQIKIDGDQKWLGAFYTEESAARAYDKAAKEAFGEFAFMNEDAGLFEEVRDKQ